MEGLAFHVGIKAFNPLDDTAAIDRYRLAKQRLGAIRSATAQMALAALGSHKYAGARQTKSLGCRFMGLQLVFLSRFCFARHCWFLLSDKIKPRGYSHARGRSHLWVLTDLRLPLPA